MKDFLREIVIILLVAIGIVILWFMDRDAQLHITDKERIEYQQHRLNEPKFTEI